jgi:dTDP-glucose 4,6-dehydratase
MNILVTGSKGVIGQKLVRELTDRGHDVFGIDLFHAPGECGYIQEMSSEDYYCRCDISEYRQIERIFTRGFDIVYNCAAEFGRWNGEDYYEQLWKSNVIGLKNILQLQERYGFKLIHFSSSEIYGDYPGVMSEGITEVTEIKQLNDYALSKWTNEIQIRNSMSLFNSESVIVRLFNTYGPGEFYHPYRSVNCKFCYHALHNLPVKIYKGYYRTSTFIDDCVRTLANISDNFISGRIYNIGSSEYHSIKALADIIWQYTNAPIALLD